MHRKTGVLIHAIALLKGPRRRIGIASLSSIPEHLNEERRSALFASPRGRNRARTDAIETEEFPPGSPAVRKGFPKPCCGNLTIDT